MITISFYLEADDLIKVIKALYPNDKKPDPDKIKEYFERSAKDRDIFRIYPPDFYIK